MKKSILGILLAACLLIGMLPAIALADTTVSASIVVGGVSLKVTAYDTPVYTVNQEYETIDTQDNTFTATRQVTSSDAENWNAKFVWETGKDAPTLYLKDFKYDEYNETTKLWKARYQSAADREDPDKKGSATIATGISMKANQPTNIVITGGESLISTRFGIHYKSATTIKSEGDAALKIYNISSAITSDGAAGIPLTVDANLNLSVESYYNGAASHILQTLQADLTINGGNIKISTPATNYIHGIMARESGNIIINGGNINVTSAVGTAPSNGSIHSLDKIIINGGTIKATAKYAVPIYAKQGIDITGGTVDITSPYYGMHCGVTNDNTAKINVTGGTVKIIAQNAMYPSVNLVLGENVKAYAGASESSAEIYDGSDTKLVQKPWMVITDDPSFTIATKPTEPLVTLPPITQPSEPITQPSGAPTVAAPTGAPTAAPTSAAQGTTATNATQGTDADSTENNTTVLLIAVCGIVVISAAAIVLIILKRKKS